MWFRLYKLDLHAQNVTPNTDDTLRQEYVELAGAPSRASEDHIYVLPIYEQIKDGSEGSFSRVPDPNDSASFTKGEYAIIAESKPLPTPIYTSLYTTPQQL